jgi:hypothetical protein
MSLNNSGVPDSRSRSSSSSSVGRQPGRPPNRWRAILTDLEIEAVARLLRELRECGSLEMHFMIASP